MRPGPVFILTFRAGLYRCPSSDLKGRYGLGGLPQRCQTSPSSSVTFSPPRSTRSPLLVCGAVTRQARCSHHHVASPRQDGGDAGASGEHRQCHAIWPRCFHLVFSIGNNGANKQLSGPEPKFGLSRNTAH